MDGPAEIRQHVNLLFDTYLERRNNLKEATAYVLDELQVFDRLGNAYPFVEGEDEWSDWFAAFLSICARQAKLGEVDGELLDRLSEAQHQLVRLRAFNEIQDPYKSNMEAELAVVAGARRRD